MAENTLQVKRAVSTAARLAFVPALGEPVWDTTLKKIYLGDGATAGGIDVGAEGLTEQQQARVYGADYRSNKPMHQTVKLIDMAHWANNLEGVLGTDFANDKHHVREGVYCLRTAEVAGAPASQATTVYYYPGTGFWLPPQTFINNRIIDIYATFDFPGATANSVVFHMGVIVDPDGTEVPTNTAKHLAYVGINDAGLDSSDKIKVHIQIQAEGRENQFSEVLRLRRYLSIGYSISGGAMNNENKGFHREFDMTQGHYINIGVSNTSGQATFYEVAGGPDYWSSSSTNYDELRMVSISAWMRGWNRSN